MEKYLNMIIDFPKLVNDKLPMNCWNSCMDDSEGNLAKWAGEVFRVGAFVTLAYSLCATVSILWTGGMGEGAQEMVGSLLGMLLFAYAAFPIAQVVRSAGESVGSSKSDTVTLIFHDIPVATIKALGHILALVALFGALAAGVSAVTNGWLDMSGAANTDWTTNFDYWYSVPTDAMTALMGLLGLEFVGGLITDFMSWSGYTTSESGYLGGLIGAAWQFVNVAIILAQLYLTLAFYKFFWGILSTFFNFIKNPYLPFRNK
tara:strand:- start:154 stop:933 length:780 start_codon:yes stop_codon:yes gene_type:complete